jgi:UDP-GlcNAc:undecaprenyl-phosphate GlcNAc-1-phosphate transferase
MAARSTSTIASLADVALLPPQRLLLLVGTLLAAFFTCLAISLLVNQWLVTNGVRGARREAPRQAQTAHIPRTGGVGVFLGFIAGMAAAAGAFAAIAGTLPAPPEFAGSLIIASSILFAIGLFDDIRGVPPLAKLTGQTLAALVVVSSGFTIEQVILVPGYQLELGWISGAVTVLWLVGVSNAFNLIDGIDGLAAGVGAIALVAIAVGAILVGNTGVPIYSIGLLGALLGFLKFNFPPARIFLGDSGSLVVGFLLAVLAVRAGTRPDGVLHGLVPLFALAYLLLDTGVAILRRWLRGAPLSRADVRHIHHQLRGLGLSPIESAGAIWLGSACLAALGLIAAFAPPAWTIAAALAGVLVLMSVLAYAIRWLGYHEFSEAGASVASAARRGRLVIRDKINARDTARLLVQAANRQEIDAILAESCATFRFTHMQLFSCNEEENIPDRLKMELNSHRLWKFEYPVGRGASEASDSFFLGIWGYGQKVQRSAGAERIAQILAPALSAWVAEKLSEVAEVRAGNLPSATDTAFPATYRRA